MVTTFAFYIQALYHKLLETLQSAESVQMLHKAEEKTEMLDELFKIASILSSILSIATGLDYSDEVGRRKVFSVVSECWPEFVRNSNSFLRYLIGDMLASPTLPFELVDPCMEMMKAMMPSEREFIRVIVEVIIDLRDHDELTEEPTEIVRIPILCTGPSESLWCRFCTTPPSQTLHIQYWDEDESIVKGRGRKTARLQI